MRRTAPLRPSQLTSLGQRLLHLKELLAFSSINEFSEFLMVNTGTIQRLITRNPNNNATISTEMIFRMAQRIPQLNLNWLITGKGVPLVDHDAMYALHKYAYYHDKITDLTNRLEDLLGELKGALDADHLPSSFSKQWNEMLEKQVLERSPIAFKEPIRLGSNEQILIKEMLEKRAYIRVSGNTHHVISKNVRLRVIRKDMFEKLLEKDLLIESENKPGKYLFNPKYRTQLKHIVNN